MPTSMIFRRCWTPREKSARERTSPDQDEISPNTDSRFEPLNHPAQAIVKTQGAFPPLRVGGADGERAGVRCASHNLRVHGGQFPGNCNVKPKLVSEAANGAIETERSGLAELKNCWKNGRGGEI